jgi:hypothetical protein
LLFSDSIGFQSGRFGLPGCLNLLQIGVTETGGGPEHLLQGSSHAPLEGLVSVLETGEDLGLDNVCFQDPNLVLIQAVLVLE